MPSFLPHDRRSFLKRSAAAGFSAAWPGSRAFAKAFSAPASHEGLKASALAPSAFSLLPLGSVRPRGWLLRQLQIQAAGLSGHLDEVWPDVGENSGWLGGKGESWERGPYYLDGLVPLAYQLGDEHLIAKAQRYIDWTLASQQPDGMFGPASNNDWWPRMVMLKVLTQYAEVRQDPRVEPFMHRYFLHQLGALPGRPLRDWGKFRWQDNVLSVLWLYERTGDAKLIELARLLHAQGHDWVGQFKNFSYTQTITPQLFGPGPNAGLSDLALATHGVNNGQAIKTGPVWYRVSGTAEDRDGALQMIHELERYHGLPNGMFSCDEHLAGRDPSHGSELCTVVESMFSLEQALAITGNAELGDRLEKLAFNALPGTFTDDMWAHQYNQEPNQVECSLHRKPWTTDGPESNLYGLEPNFGCCTANFHQGWPKFTASLFMRTRDNGLAVAAYAPGQVDTTVGGQRVKLTQQTEYPFRGSVRLTLECDRHATFPLHLRIPAWAVGTTLRVNNRELTSPPAGAFAVLKRTWQAGDVIELTFPMLPRVVNGFRGSVSLERGPLVFSYDIAGSWVELRNRGRTHDWQVFPARPWNYALSLPSGGSQEELAHISEHPLSDTPFGAEHAPVRLAVSARQLDHWRAVDGAADAPPQSPVESQDPLQTIELIPYAAAKLRITSFPLLKT